MKHAVALFFGISISVLCASPQAPSSAAALKADAIKAYQAKDYPAFLSYEKRALELEPDNPRTVYNVACGEALQGNAREAVRLLEQLLAKKLDLGAEADGDFSAIHKTPEWSEFESRLAELREPFATSKIAFTIPDAQLVATGVAVDEKTGDTFVGSVRERKIVRRTKHGTVSDFIRQAQDGFMSADSLAVDRPRGLLYATTSAAPYMLGYQKEDSGRSGLFAFHLKTGKLARKVMLAPDGKMHLLNALAVDHAGNVYVSDTGASGIYLLRPEASEFQIFVPSTVFRATQGLALSKDEKTLYVADYADGLWALDIATRQRHQVLAPRGVWLFGLDGISRWRNSLIAVQIGPKPDRVLRLSPNANNTELDQIEILEMARSDYQGPIQGAVSGRNFFYVANSQLDLGNGRTGAFAADRAHPTIVLRLPLQ